MTRDPATYSWLSSALLADNGAAAMDAQIKPLLPSWRFLGRALTVQVAQGDNLALHAALSIVEPGQVLVVAAGGYRNRAIIGGLMTRQARASNVAGIVIDGAIRDTVELRELDLPVFSIGAHPLGPSKTGERSAVGIEIECGGVRVANGDWVFADADGVAVFADADFDAIVEKAHDKLKREEKRIADIAFGKLLPPWLAQALAEAGLDVKKPS